MVLCHLMNSSWVVRIPQGGGDTHPLSYAKEFFWIFFTNKWWERKTLGTNTFTRALVLTPFGVFTNTQHWQQCQYWHQRLCDSVRINRAWLYKGPKASVLQANVNLVQKGECWTTNQRLWGYERPGLYSHWGGVTFFTGFFLFSRSKFSDANIGMIDNFV